jgi:hypothetical protein
MRRSLECRLCPDLLDSCILAPHRTLPLTCVSLLPSPLLSLAPTQPPMPSVVLALPHRVPQVVLLSLPLRRLRIGSLSSPTGWIV